MNHNKDVTLFIHDIVVKKGTTITQQAHSPTQKITGRFKRPVNQMTNMLN